MRWPFFIRGSTPIQQPSRARKSKYCTYCVSALLKSWPGLADKDVSRITNTECLQWSVKNASTNNSPSQNYTVSILCCVFAVAIESGVRYDNPAAAQLVAAPSRALVFLNIPLPRGAAAAALQKTVQRLSEPEQRGRAETVETVFAGLRFVFHPAEAGC